MTEISKMPNSLEEFWMPFTANRDFKANPRTDSTRTRMFAVAHIRSTLG